MGIATISYTAIADSDTIPSLISNSITISNRTFNGFITNLYQQPIPKTEGWYSINVTMIAVT